MLRQEDAMNYEFVEIRPGKFAKLKGGEVVGVVSAEEAEAYGEAAAAADVDAGVMKLAVAISATSAVLVSSFSDHSLGRWLAAATFFFSLAATMYLVGVFVRKRIPLTITEFRTRHPAGKWFACWTLFSWPIRIGRFLLTSDYYQDSGEESRRFILEIAYLILLSRCLLLFLLATLFALEQV
jgi:hypothetical protein